MRTPQDVLVLVSQLLPLIKARKERQYCGCVIPMLVLELGMPFPKQMAF